MSEAEWILTFDDGPLPSDVEKAEGVSDEELLDPLKRILEALKTHPDGPIPAVFFVRGPGYPWRDPPAKRIFERGVRMMLDAGHRVGIHCYRHDPKLWWGWMSPESNIKEDLDQCVEYFEPMLDEPMTAFRPPYGQGGFPAFQWAAEHDIKYHLVDVDTKDWRHHPDALFPRWVDDPGGHLNHMLNSLMHRMWFHTLSSGANDILFHVSDRTACFLPLIVDKISEVTRQLGHRPEYVVPDEYMGIRHQ